MTNKHLIKNWRSLAIKFKASKEVIPLTELFLLCVGESEISVGNDKELVVAFYQGYSESGSPAVFFTSDNRKRCWTFAHKDGNHIKSNVGSFVEEMPQRNESKRKKASTPKED